MLPDACGCRLPRLVPPELRLHVAKLLVPGQNDDRRARCPDALAPLGKRRYQLPARWPRRNSVRRHGSLGGGLGDPAPGVAEVRDGLQFAAQGSDLVGEGGQHGNGSVLDRGDALLGYGNGFGD